MAETYAWDEIGDVCDEVISEDDQKKSEDISNKRFLGQALYTIEKCEAIERNGFNNGVKYPGMAANLTLKLERVIGFEDEVKDENGETILKKNGFALTKYVKVVGEEMQEKQDLKWVGTFTFDNVMLFNAQEAEATKKRRLFVAKQIGIMGIDATELKTSAWASAVGKQVIVTTIADVWEKNPDDFVLTIKVARDGYKKAAEEKEIDYTDI